MAIPYAAPGNQNPVSTTFKGLKDIHRINHSTAHHSYDAHISRIIKAACPRYISRCIGTPITSESNEEEVDHSYSTQVDSEGNYTLDIDPSLISGEHKLVYYQIDDLGNKSETRTLNLTVGSENFPEWLLRQLGLLPEEGEQLTDGESIPEVATYDKVADTLEENQSKTMLLAFAGVGLLFLIFVAAGTGYVIIKKTRESDFDINVKYKVE